LQNFELHINAYNGTNESFSYDDLNRLKTGDFGDMKYDETGNITFKNYVGDYVYDDEKKHAVTEVSKNLNPYFNHDITYTYFGKVETIVPDSPLLPTMHITYGPTHQRNEVNLFFDDGTRLRRRYLPNMEITEFLDYKGDVESQSMKEYIHSPYGLVAIYYGSDLDPDSEFDPLLDPLDPILPDNPGLTGISAHLYVVATDHLGSIVAEWNPRKPNNSFGPIGAPPQIGDYEFFGYDAWGRRYRFDGSGMWPPNYFWFDENLPFTLNLSPEEILDFFARGYTGHEHLDMFGLINMNGRMYDPVIARFLSPDPYVPDATYTQDFNRYTYARNNPLTYIDPDGEFITWSVSKGGFSIGFNLSPIGIPLGAGINIGWSNGGSAGVYGEVGYRVGGTGFGSGATVSQSLDYGFGTSSWSTTTSAGAYASFGPFNAGGNVSYTHGKNGGWNWGVSGGVNLYGSETFGLGLNVGYGSGGWTYGVGGYYNPGVTKTTTIVDRELQYVDPKGEYNCGPACGESASRGLILQDDLRCWLGGDPRTQGVDDIQLWREWEKRTGRRVDIPNERIGKRGLFTNFQNGIDISVSVPGESISHSVLINKATKEVRTMYGVSTSKYRFQVMSPGVGRYVPTPGFHLTGRNYFFLFPRR
jgi:RHS repeat-associated protein